MKIRVLTLTAALVCVPACTPQAPVNSASATPGAVAEISRTQFMTELFQLERRSEAAVKRAKSQFASSPERLNQAQVGYDRLRANANGLLESVAVQVALGKFDRQAVRAQTEALAADSAAFEGLLEGTTPKGALPALVITIVDGAAELYGKYRTMAAAERKLFADELRRHTWKEWKDIPA